MSTGYEAVIAKLKVGEQVTHQATGQLDDTPHLVWTGSDVGQLLPPLFLTVDEATTLLKALAALALADNDSARGPVDACQIIWAAVFTGTADARLGSLATALAELIGSPAAKATT